MKLRTGLAALLGVVLVTPVISLVTASSASADPCGPEGNAIACEKKLKGWRRARKIALIEKVNPRWSDLSDDWEQQPKFYDRPWKTEEMI